MSAASCLLTEDQFLCSICLDVFTDPVAIPCGHNFCKTCITQHWDINVPYKCPNCKEVFNMRPKLQVNNLISEMAAQFRQSAQQKASRMCTKHDKLLELFCKTDQMCVCMLCSISDHQRHSVVPLKEEYEGKKAELGKTDIFSALKKSIERSQAELIDTIKEKQRETEKQAEGFIKELEQEISELEKRSSEVEQLSQSEDHLHLVQSFPSLNMIKISEVKKRSPLQFWKLSNLLQSFPSLNTAPPTKDWTGVSIPPPVYEETMFTHVYRLIQGCTGKIRAKILLCEHSIERLDLCCCLITV
uniref:Uncharacterized protein n=1 Tax=Sparus aurata TaxID=8175 RepID=A0A671U1N6_SPAAU